MTNPFRFCSVRVLRLHNISPLPPRWRGLNVQIEHIRPVHFCIMANKYMVTVFNATFNYIAAVRFIGGGNRGTRRKQPTCRKSLINFITQSCIEYTSAWTGFELTTLVVIGTDCIGSCKSNYHTIKTSTTPNKHMEIFDEIWDIIQGQTESVAITLSSKSSGRNWSVIFRYKSIRHVWHTGDDKK